MLFSSQVHPPGVLGSVFGHCYGYFSVCKNKALCLSRKLKAHFLENRRKSEKKRDFAIERFEEELSQSLQELRNTWTS